MRFCMKVSLVGVLMMVSFEVFICVSISMNMVVVLSCRWFYLELLMMILLLCVLYFVCSVFSGFCVCLKCFILWVWCIIVVSRLCISCMMVFFSGLVFFCLLFELVCCYVRVRV